jgi:hypothetical protein
MSNSKKLLKSVKESERANPTLKEQLDHYRERRRAYDEMQRGKGEDGGRDTNGKHRTERRYVR